MRYIYTIICLFAAVLAYGRSVTFVTKESTPISDVKCIGYSASEDSIASWVSNSKGVIEIKTDGVNYIVASHPEYSDKIIFIKTLNEENTAISMSPNVKLQELVVTPSDIEEFDTHTSYRISQADMGRYATVYESLNEIPNMTVLSNGAIFYEGDSNIKILIDGVEASAQEVQSLAKEDIAKVDVYQTPPLRFLSQGISTVVDIRLKSKIYGGNVAINIDQAFQILNGNNYASLNYNYKQSRFQLLYTNTNKHHRKSRKSEELDYEFDGVEYKKIKEGLDSKNHLDDNTIFLSYQINKPQNFLNNTKAGFSINRNGGTFNQNVTTGSDSFLATNHLFTGYTRYHIGNYFEKDLGEKYGLIYVDLYYQHYSTTYNSAYNEMSDSPLALNDSHSEYKTDLDAIHTILQYQFPRTKIGYFSISAYDSYKHSKYADSTLPFYQSINSLSGYAQWLWIKGPISGYVSMGVNWDHTSSNNYEKSYNVIIPSPKVNFTWKPSRNFRMVLNYSYTVASPTIAQLSETDQWLDTRLVYHGNSELRSYKMHSVDLRINWYFKYLNLSMYNSFESSPGMICDMYKKTDKYMLQTIVNLSTYRTWSTMLDLSIKPLGNSKLVFWNRLIFANLKGKNPDYSWVSNRFQWMSNLALNLKHWTFSLFYQYPGKAFNGQIVSPRAQAWSISALYRPMTNLSIGLNCLMPFGKSFKEREYTVKEAPVFADTRYESFDMNNLVSIKFIYNFSFGRNRNEEGPRVEGNDNDSGILRK